jgi:hypothetical protein
MTLEGSLRHLPRISPGRSVGSSGEKSKSTRWKALTCHLAAQDNCVPRCNEAHTGASEARARWWSALDADGCERPLRRHRSRQRGGAGKSCSRAGRVCTGSPGSPATCGDGHKRLMVLATIAMLPPALGRALSAVVGASHPALFFGATMLFLVAIGIHDWRTSGRVHPVSLWRGLCLAVSFPGRLALGNTDTWLIFAGWLTR